MTRLDLTDKKKKHCGGTGAIAYFSIFSRGEHRALTKSWAGPEHKSKKSTTTDDTEYSKHRKMTKDRYSTINYKL